MSEKKHKSLRELKIREAEKVLLAEPVHETYLQDSPLLLSGFLLSKPLFSSEIPTYADYPYVAHPGKPLYLVLLDFYNFVQQEKISEQTRVPVSFYGFQSSITKTMTPDEMFFVYQQGLRFQRMNELPRAPKKNAYQRLSETDRAVIQSFPSVVRYNPAEFVYAFQNLIFPLEGSPCYDPDLMIESLEHSARLLPSFRKIKDKYVFPDEKNIYLTLMVRDALMHLKSGYAVPPYFSEMIPSYFNWPTHMQKNPLRESVSFHVPPDRHPRNYYGSHHHRR